MKAAKNTICTVTDMKPCILVKIYILCACTLDVAVSSLGPLFKPSTLLPMQLHPSKIQALAV